MSSHPADGFAASLLAPERVFDIAGKDREGLEVKGLLNLFEQQRDLTVDDDSLLLS